MHWESPLFSNGSPLPSDIEMKKNKRQGVTQLHRHTRMLRQQIVSLLIYESQTCFWCGASNGLSSREYLRTLLLSGTLYMFLTFFWVFFTKHFSPLHTSILPLLTQSPSPFHSSISDRSDSSSFAQFLHSVLSCVFQSSYLLIIWL